MLLVPLSIEGGGRREAWKEGRGRGGDAAAAAAATAWLLSITEPGRRKKRSLGASMDPVLTMKPASVTSGTLLLLSGLCASPSSLHSQPLPLAAPIMPAWKT